VIDMMASGIPDAEQHYGSARFRSIVKIATLVRERGVTFLIYAPIAAIQKEAGIPESTFHRQLGSRPDLIRYCFESGWDVINAYLKHATFVPDGEGDGRAQLSAEVRRLAALWTDGDEELRTVATCALYMRAARDDLHLTDDRCLQAAAFDHRLAALCRAAGFSNPVAAVEDVMALFTDYWCIWLTRPDAQNAMATVDSLVSEVHDLRDRVSAESIPSRRNEPTSAAESAPAEGAKRACADDPRIARTVSYLASSKSRTH
jgi:AcrR family transcriptional regulator